MTEAETIRMIAASTGAFSDPFPAFVVFRKFRKSYGDYVIAMFPSCNHESGDANRYCVMSYVHIGQHGECDPQHVINVSRAATPEEYADLKSELESMGYVLTVQKRLQLRYHLARSKRIKDALDKLRTEAAA